MTARKPRGPTITNTYVEDGNKRYRICRINGAVAMIGVRRNGGRERMYDTEGYRARQILKLESPTGE